MDYRDDPDYLLALACYRFPDADSATGRDVLRLEALLEMRTIQRRLRTYVPRPTDITASPSSTRSRSAFRAVLGAMSCSWDSPSADGSREPGG